MRRTIAGVVLVLCAVACVCASSLFTILHTVDGMETLRMQSLERAGEGDLEGAEEYLTKLARALARDDPAPGNSHRPQRPAQRGGRDHRRAHQPGARLSGRLL